METRLAPLKRWNLAKLSITKWFAPALNKIESPNAWLKLAKTDRPLPVATFLPFLLCLLPTAGWINFFVDGINDADAALLSA
jgi:hypothetical protein